MKTTSEMSLEDLTACVNALQRWCEDQGLKPIDAMEACCILTAGIIAANAEDVCDLNYAINAVQRRIAHVATCGFVKWQEEKDE